MTIRIPAPALSLAYACSSDYNHGDPNHHECVLGSVTLGAPMYFLFAIDGDVAIQVLWRNASDEVIEPDQRWTIDISNKAVARVKGAMEVSFDPEQGRVNVADPKGGDLSIITPVKPYYGTAYDWFFGSSALRYDTKGLTTMSFDRLLRFNLKQYGFDKIAEKDSTHVWQQFRVSRYVREGDATSENKAYFIEFPAAAPRALKGYTALQVTGILTGIDMGERNPDVFFGHETLR